MKKTILAATLSAAAGFGVCWQFFRQVETRTEYKTKWREKRDVVTVERIVQRPGGETVTVRTIQDRTTTEQQTTRKETVKPVQPDWLLSGRAGLRADGSPIYGAALQRRFLGPFFVGGYVDSNLSAGVSVSFQF